MSGRLNSAQVRAKKKENRERRRVFGLWPNTRVISVSAGIRQSKLTLYKRRRPTPLLPAGISPPEHLRQVERSRAHAQAVIGFYGFGKGVVETPCRPVLKLLVFGFVPFFSDLSDPGIGDDVLVSSLHHRMVGVLIVDTRVLELLEDPALIGDLIGIAVDGLFQYSWQVVEDARSVFSLEDNLSAKSKVVTDEDAGPEHEACRQGPVCGVPETDGHADAVEYTVFCFEYAEHPVPKPLVIGLGEAQRRMNDLDSGLVEFFSDHGFEGVVTDRLPGLSRLRRGQADEFLPSYFF